MSVYSLSRFIRTEVDLFNYPSLILRIREPVTFNPTALTSYIFTSADNLRLISYKFYGVPHLWWAILDANPFYQSELDIKVGDIIKIPPSQEVSLHV